MGILIPLVVGCKQFDKLTQFDVDYNTEYSIATGINIDLPFDIHTPEIETNADATFSAHQTKSDLIESAHLKVLDLTIKAPANGDFSFLKSVTIYIQADGLEEKKIAWYTDVTGNIGKSISLEIDEKSNLKPYLLSDSIHFRVNTITDKVITGTYTIGIDATFFVDAKIFGV